MQPDKETKDKERAAKPLEKIPTQPLPKVRAALCSPQRNAARPTIEEETRRALQVAASNNRYLLAFSNITIEEQIKELRNAIYISRQAFHLLERGESSQDLSFALLISIANYWSIELSTLLFIDLQALNFIPKKALNRKKERKRVFATHLRRQI